MAFSSPYGIVQNYFSSIFDLGPLNPKIYFPKFGTKSPISRLVWQIHRKCLGLLGGFRDGRFNGIMQNVEGPTFVAMATTFALGAESNRLPVCPDVCPSVTLLQIASFLFLDGIEPFLAVISLCAPQQN